MAVNTPYSSVTGFHSEIIKNFSPYLEIDSSEPEKTTRKMENKTIATIEAIISTNCLNPSSIHLSPIGRFLSMNSCFEGMDTSIGLTIHNLFIS